MIVGSNLTFSDFSFFPIFWGFDTPSHHHHGLTNPGTPVPSMDHFFLLGNASRPVCSLFLFTVQCQRKEWKSSAFLLLTNLRFLWEPQEQPQLYWKRIKHWIFQSLNESIFSLNTATVTDLSKVWTNHCKLIACMQSLSRVRSQVACFNFRSKDLTCLKNLAILSCHTNFRLKPETLTVDQWPLPLYLDYKS